MAYEYTNSRGIKYYLHKKEVKLRGSDHVQTIYFFKRNPEENAVDDLPQGYTVKESERNALPVLSKK